MERIICSHPLTPYRKPWLGNRYPNCVRPDDFWQDIQLTSICHILLRWIIPSGAELRCGRYEHSLNGQRCCRECPPGEGVLRPCSIYNDTVCQPCTFGESYSTVYSHVETCHPCSICPEYAHMIQPCNMTHDTMCECDRNYYFDGLSSRCRPCQVCPMEYGVRRQCNLTHDTVCVRCPEGFYSDRLGMERCKRCGRCGRGQVMLQHCSPGQNTICIDIPTVHSTPWYQHEGATQSTLPNGSGRGRKVNPIPIYCALLGAVVLALIVYVIIKQNRRRQQANKGLTTSSSNETPPLLTAAPSSGGLLSKQGSDSGVYVELDRPVTSGTKVRDLPAIKRKALENSMHGYAQDPGGWKMLARELGFSNPVISSIESRAHQDGFSPFGILLSEWGKRDNARVGQLIQALRNIHREDCVRILCGDNRDYVGAPKYLELSSMHNQQII
ncbi:hypothetical protein LSH36_950g00048 [Paralvinella palmiformis]|uniref:Tumor necrosis factor receptor superfamily member 16 n=1 Tax=Paralvinella palmiformis TaxID=53620 RepID=A0AAD9IWY7_9ANNE|nr:hypothetical protein LSH36_950g00048 [Paralvinella palmiformis]